MTEDLAQTHTKAVDGILRGPLRRSVNNSAQAAGSIHDDATATRLGFRGGTVAGSIHMELFPPLLVEVFGQRWFERGTLSLYFVNATTDREAVRAFVQQPPSGSRDVQVDVWVERGDGMRVAEGTASVGEVAEPTALGRRPLDRFESGELRLLEGIGPGFEFDPVEARVPVERQESRKAVITEPLDWYFGPSPWGAPIATPATMVNLLYARSMESLRGRIGPSVGLFGAIELRNIHGPVFVDRPYRITGQVLTAGQSPKTEYLWFETGADDSDGRRTAEMRMLLRWMKASSPKYR